MPFDVPVGTDERAIGRCKSPGFDAAGRRPLAPGHARAGTVDALVLFRAT